MNLGFMEKKFQNEYESLIVPQIRNITSKPSLNKSPNLRTFEFKNDLFIKWYVKKNDKDYKTYPYGFIPN